MHPGQDTAQKVPYARKSARQALREQGNIITAVILRDLRSRFFNHGLGFLIVPLFPFVHLAALLIINNLMGRAVIYGDDLNVFLGTALIPTLTFMYVTRFMSMSLIENTQMLSYPIINILDIVFARAILEILAAIYMIIAVFVVFSLMGSDPYPADIVEACKAFLATAYLSLSVGIIVSLLSKRSVTFLFIWSLFLIIVYILSGAFFVGSFLPEQVLMILSWNPVLHCTEWMRLAYFPGYSDQVLDKTYLLGFATTCLIGGLLGERLFRRQLMSR